MAKRMLISARLAATVIGCRRVRKRGEKRLAAALSRRLCTRMSRTLPSWLTARHRYFRSPLILMKDLVQVPPVPRPRLPAAQHVGIGLPELAAPAAHVS